MPEQLVPYEDEIDLRALVLTLWRGKWTILLATFVTAMLALLISLVMPREYEASALVSLRVPRLHLHIQEDRFAFAVETPDLKTVTALAQSPAVFQAVAADPEIQTKGQGEETLDWQTLARKAKASAVGAQGLQLTVRDTDPQRAVLIADRWAAEVARQINQQYGYLTVLEQLGDEVQQAQEAYQTAEASYVQALAQNRRAILAAQLTSAQKDLNCVLASQAAFQRLKKDLAALDEYMQGLSEEALLSPGDTLTLTLIQQRVLAPEICASDADGHDQVQIQWQAADLTPMTVSEARRVSKALQEVLERKMAALPSQQEALGKQVLQLQRQLEEEKSQLQILAHQQEVARDTFQALDALATQIKVLRKTNGEIVTVLASAVVPSVPVSPRLAMNVALAAVFGAVVGILIVLVGAWWRDDAAEPSVDTRGPLENVADR